MHTKDLITIITPVGNGAAYLPECMDSILSQTYKDLEIILIDDGSTDRTAEICVQYEQRDSRIRYIHFEEKKGQGARRNYGFGIAHGKYIGFVDGDDVILPEMFSTLHQMISSQQADLAVCRYQTAPQFTSCGGSHEEVVDGKGAVLRFLTDPSFGAFSWNKLFLADLLRESGQYPEGMYYEDVVYIPQVCMNARKVILTDRPMYYYRQHQNSVVGSKFSSSKMDQVKAYDMLVPVLLSKYPDLSVPIHEKAFLGVMGVFNVMTRDCRDSLSETKEILLKKAREYSRHIPLNQAADKKKVWFFFLALHCPRLYSCFLKVACRKS